MKKIDRQILQTLIYADLFDYPLTRSEIWRYLIGDKCKHSKFCDGLELLIKNKQIYFKHEFFALPKRSAIIKQRIIREKNAKQKNKYADQAAKILKYIPSVWYIGISGAVAMNNAPKDDDVDFFIITSPQALWVTRFLTTVILDIFNLRRRPFEKTYSNKICLNMFLSSKQLKMSKLNQNLFVAHEITQLKTLINKHETYERFLLNNGWIMKFLPQALIMPKKTLQIKINFFNQFLSIFEKASKYLQVLYMKNKITHELISDTVIKFHPDDANVWVLNKYRQKINTLNKL